MCGILGVYVNKSGSHVYDNLKSIYTNQKSRGTIGCGFTIMGGSNNGFHRKRGSNSDYFFSNKYFNLDIKRLADRDKIIMHHRFATSGGGGNIYESNHPFINENRTLTLIHNGVINNDTALYRQLLKDGHTFESEVVAKTRRGQIANREITDSEVILHMIESNDDIEAGLKKISEVKGSIAIAFMYKGIDAIFLYCRGNPIVVSKDSYNNFYFSSVYDTKNIDLTKVKELDEGMLYSISNTGLNKHSKIESVANWPTLKSMRSKESNFDRDLTSYYEYEWDKMRADIRDLM